MCAYLLQMCVFVWALTVMGGTPTNAAKVTGDRGFEPVGNELFSNSGMQNKKKLKGTGIKLHNSIFKSKVEVLGEVLKKHVNRLRKADSKQVELVFLMDSSASVGAENFESEVKFVQKLLSDFTVSENTTRVSVIAYSSPGSVVRHVDHMTSPSHNNHKCGLLHHELPNIKYIGGGTYTRGALLEAQSVLKHARKNSTQALFLITDGFSNGGDPLPVAYELKEQGVTIFTFGIHNGNTKELYDMASQPGEEYSYILDSFGEFEAMVRRALHEDLKAGSYQVLGNSSHCNSRCDKLASCSCGTHTGHFACLCPPGYYGSGLADTCKFCPNGTYSLGLVPGDVSICQSCPDKRHVTVAPATSAKDCHCKNGLVSTGTYCKTATCPKLSAPQGGYFVTKSCGNVVNTACEMSCRMGYKLTGSRKRLCQDDGIWSGKETKCIARSCAPMKSPKNGDVSCNSDNYVVDTDCDFSCHPGYSLTGSRQRNCLPTARWDGLSTSCKPILCPPLPEVPNSVMSQDNCTTRQQLYGTHCNITCQSGYQLKGPKSRKCGSLGRWSGQNINFCEDVTPPDIVCPEDIVVPSLPGEDYATVNWKIMSVSDNSGLPPKLWTKPSTRQPMTVKIGNRTITYIASDASQLRSKCDFTITVEDEEPPVIHSCESPPPFLLDTGDNSSLVWDPPVFEDNSGFPIQVVKPAFVSRSPDTDKFPFGTTPVTYIASDASGNTAKCVLNITVEENVCVEPSGLHHGHVNCSTNVESLHCTLTCDEGYAFAMQHRDYFCTYDSDGSVLAPDNSIDPFPDCSLTVLPNSLSQEGTIILEGNGTVCEDEDFLSQLEDDLRKKIAEELAGICSTEVSCSVEDVSASCDQVLSGLEEESNVLSRKKRHAQKMSNVSRVNEAVYVPDTHSLLRGNKINLRFQMKSQSKQRNNTAQANNQHLQLNMNKMKDAVRLATRKGTLLNVISTSHRRRQMRVKEVELWKAPKLVCDAGSVLKGKVCVLCPLGTYWNLTSKACESCPIGSYQPYEGSITCLACPPGTSTRKIHAKSLRDCHPLCPPGSFGRKRKQWQSGFPGLAPCRSCDYGSYQSRAGQTECWRCPGNWTTLRRGSTRLDDCKAPCPPGEISRTGLVPCVKCPPGYSQPYLRQKLCYSDTGGESIGVECVFLPCQNRGVCRSLAQDYFLCDCPPGFVGSLCEQALKGCDTDPCLHGATCVDTAPMHYMCICSHGYLGDRCELEVDECLSDPCQNGATCIDRVNSFLCVCADGFQGMLCEENIDDCSMKPCVHNATCVDSLAGYSCVCPKGYSGRLCEMEPLDSCRDEPCYNNATCISKASEYRCLCAEGFEGVHCEINANDCNTSLCENGGTCVDLVAGYECMCLPKFSGRHCEIELPSEYFLHFPSSGTTDYVLLRGPPSPLSQIVTRQASFIDDKALHQANTTEYLFSATWPLILYYNLKKGVLPRLGYTKVCECIYEDFTWIVYPSGMRHKVSVCFWLKSADSFNYGTVFSYATNFSDNTFTLTDYNGFVLYINGERIVTDITANDGFWHSVCVMWESTDGAWSIYLDGKLGDNGTGLANGSHIPGGGVVILGQEQDTLGSGFSEAESFTGHLSSLAIWDHLLQDIQIWDLTTRCGRTLSSGNLFGWTDFLHGIHGNLKIENSSFCSNCAELQVPFQGSVNVTGSVAIYTCNSGFYLKWNGGEYDMVERKCLKQGIWEGLAPICVRKSCGFPGYFPRGMMLGRSYRYKDVIRYQCNTGYKQVGTAIRVCMANGKWSGEVPVCQGKACDEVAAPLNGRLKSVLVDSGEVPWNNSIALQYGHQVELECEEGFHLEGSNFLTCLEDGQWDEPIPTCQALGCKNPPVVSNGYLKTTPAVLYAFGTRINYECQTGYKIQQLEEVSCAADGKWHGEVQCNIVECTPPAKLENGKIFKQPLAGDQQFVYNSSVMATCNVGFKLVGPTVLYCLVNGTWSVGQPRCERVSCDISQLPEDKNGNLSVSGNHPGDWAFFDCVPGHRLSLSTDATHIKWMCHDSETWVNENPNVTVTRNQTLCVPHIYNCDEPKDPENGYILREESVKNYTIGRVLKLKCRLGYTLQGSNISVCQEGGVWSHSNVTCAPVQCESPPAPHNTDLENSAEVYVYGNMLNFRCNEGYQAYGVMTSRCLANAKWSRVRGKCARISCGKPPVSNGATILGNSYLYQDQVVYNCPTGMKVTANPIITCLSNGTWSGSPTCENI